MNGLRQVHLDYALKTVNSVVGHGQAVSGFIKVLGCVANVVYLFLDGDLDLFHSLVLMIMVLLIVVVVTCTPLQTRHLHLQKC